MDSTYTIIWWITLMALGMITMPLSSLLFPKFIDKGYGLSKILSILILSFSIFVFSSFHILTFSFLSLLIIIIILTTLNVILLLRYKTIITNNLKVTFRAMIIEEALFATGLFLWAYVRAHQPDINGLEKFMDFGFVNAALRSDYLPPHDIWFSGNSINYYWFGHFVTAVLTKLTAIPSTVTYNLMLGTIMGFMLSGIFSITSSLTHLFDKKFIKTALAAGILSATLATFGGNFHPHFFYARKTLLTNSCQQPDSCPNYKNITKEYWYPDATRFIGYDPETDDKTIHEFPIYSFVVSDLHAHLNNVPFVLLYLAFIIRYVYRPKKINYKDNLGYIIPLGFLIGIFSMTNTWDVANYLLLTGIVHGFSELTPLIGKKEIKILEVLGNLISKGIYLLFVIGSVAYATSYPFSRNFKSIAQGVDFVNAHSPFWQLLVLWGFPLILSILFLAAFSKSIRERKIKRTDIVVLSIFITSLILVLVPEIIYVKDIYIASHHRANTVFKLTYQAYLMTYITSGYVAIRIITSQKWFVMKLLLVILIGSLFSSLLYYPYRATMTYYNELKTYSGLTGDTWFSKRYPDEYAITQWFNSFIEGAPVILEAPGDSYTDYNVISSYTGLPTVSGWYVHEWLWRGDPAIPQARVDDIQNIYLSDDIDITKTLLQKYEVKYVIIGTLERKKYTTINEDKFNLIGTKVFSSGNSHVYSLD